MSTHTYLISYYACMKCGMASVHIFSLIPVCWMLALLHADVDHFLFLFIYVMSMFWFSLEFIQCISINGGVSLHLNSNILRRNNG